MVLLEDYGDGLRISAGELKNLITYELNKFLSLKTIVRYLNELYIYCRIDRKKSLICEKNKFLSFDLSKFFILYSK